MARPAAGSSQSSQPWAPRSSVTASTARWNAVPMPPHSRPMGRASTSQRSSIRAISLAEAAEELRQKKLSFSPAAQAELAVSGFVMGKITKERNDGLPNGTVIRFTDTSVKAGEKYDYGTVVELTVSYRTDPETD